MKVFMPAMKKKLVPYPKYPTFHITIDEVCSGHTIFCTASGDTVPLRGYYGDLLPRGSHETLSLPGEILILLLAYVKSLGIYRS